MPRELAIFGAQARYANGFPAYNTIGEDEKKAVMEVLDSGELSGFVASPDEMFWGGKHVRALEDAFKSTYESKEAVSFNSATSALHAAMWAADINPGDEVIVPPYTMSATATTVLMVGGIPIFLDIEDSYYALDPAKLNDALSKRTKAIVAVNLFGHPADLAVLSEFAKAHDLLLIEDNSQAPHALSNGAFTGTVGDIGVFSFNRHKTMQSGEGGVAITNNRDLAEKMAFLRNHGENVVEHFNKADLANTAGLNLRMTEMEAAVAQVQFQKLEKLNGCRIELAEYFSEKIRDLPFLKAPETRPDCSHVYYVYPVQFNGEAAGLTRDAFVQCLLKDNYPVRAGYVLPLYRSRIYQERLFMGNRGFPFTENDRDYDACYTPANFPVTEKLESDTLIIANMVYPPLEFSDIDNFVEDCCRIVDKSAAVTVALADADR